MKQLISRFIDKNLPILGICLGHQALIQYFGGTLQLLPEPVHGKSTQIQLTPASRMFLGLGGTITVGRYHSIYASTSQESMPDCLRVTAECDGIVMAFEHVQLPIYGVQFHLESILSNRKEALHILGTILNRR
jgi:anthranilate synthase